MLEISDAWSYQDINHILTTHDTHQHMYRVIPMISSPIATTVAEYSNDGHSRDSEGSPSFRRVVMSRLRTYLPLLRYVLILACTFFLPLLISLHPSHTNHSSILPFLPTQQHLSGVTYHHGTLRNVLKFDNHSTFHDWFNFLCYHENNNEQKWKWGNESDVWQ